MPTTTGEPMKAQLLAALGFLLLVGCADIDSAVTHAASDAGIDFYDAHLLDTGHQDAEIVELEERQPDWEAPTGIYSVPWAEQDWDNDGELNGEDLCWLVFRGRRCHELFVYVTFNESQPAALDAHVVVWVLQYWYDPDEDRMVPTFVQADSYSTLRPFFESSVRWTTSFAWPMQQEVPHRPKGAQPRQMEFFDAAAIVVSVREPGNRQFEPINPRHIKNVWARPHEVSNVDPPAEFVHRHQLPAWYQVETRPFYDDFEAGVWVKCLTPAPVGLGLEDYDLCRL